MEISIRIQTKKKNHLMNLWLFLFVSLWKVVSKINS